MLQARTYDIGNLFVGSLQITLACSHCGTQIGDTVQLPGEHRRIVENASNRPSGLNGRVNCIACSGGFGQFVFESGKPTGQIPEIVAAGNKSDLFGFEALLRFAKKE